MDDHAKDKSCSSTTHNNNSLEDLVTPSSKTDYCDDLLALLAPPGESMDLDWLIDEHDHTRHSSDEPVLWSLRNVSATSRSLAQCEPLSDQSSVSRSFAAAPAAPALKAEQPAPLANMSAVSHNLANVGALPQCNQRHARCVAPVAVAEEHPPHAVLVTELPRPVEARTLLDLSTAQQGAAFRFSTGHVVAPAPQTAKPRGRRLQRSAATDDQQKKLEMRRTKNREAAERMRRRRREETAGLEKTVRELTARVDELSAKLAASEAENQQLRGLKQLVLAVATQPQPDDTTPSLDPAASKLIADQVARLIPTEEQPAN